ncbi:MAG: hypothetical protein HZY79_15730 [Rhodoblastus sp.]|nr:MAG: hypothetical protein HZY79_15730 [Rhodoblastus sp.]
MTAPAKVILFVAVCGVVYAVFGRSGLAGFAAAVLTGLWLILGERRA